MFTALTSTALHNVRFRKCEVPISNIICNMISMESSSYFEQSEHGVSTAVIEGKLKNTKAVVEDGFTCYKIKSCTYCTSVHCGPPTEATHLFINKKTGNFLCHQCKTTGRWSDLEKMLRSLDSNKSTLRDVHMKSEFISYDMGHEWQKILNTCSSLCDLDDETYSAIMQEFRLVLCSKKLLQKLDVKINSERNLLFFPLLCQGTVVGYQTLDSSGKGFTYPKAECPGVICSSSSSSSSSDMKSSTVIVVANVEDLIALKSVKLSYSVVCLPYGVQTLPQNILPLFEEYKKIILWLGTKCGAWHSSIQFARKLNEKRCYLVRPTEGKASPAKAVSSGENVKSLIADAKPIWHPFVTTFGTLREDVLAEIQNIDEITGIPWTRFPTLNNILKGHRRGELTVLTGPTGSGKTTFLSEYSLDLAMNGVNTLWGSFEIKNSRLARTMLQQYSGISFTADNVHSFHEWADKFENLPIYFLTFHGQHSLKTVMNAVEHCSYTYDISHVVIDNIQFMIDVGSDDKFLGRFWTQDCILQAFRKFATLNNCHVTLVIHPRKEMAGTDLSTSSIFGSAKASQEADNILIIQEKDVGPVNSKRKYLQICKNRFSGDTGCIPLDFDKKSLSFAQKRKHCGLKNTEAKPGKVEETSEDDGDDRRRGIMNVQNN